MHFDYNPEKAAYREAALAYMHGAQSVDCEPGTLPSGQVENGGISPGKRYQLLWRMGLGLQRLFAQDTEDTDNTSEFVFDFDNE
jgi:hypothetical protein